MEAYADAPEKANASEREWNYRALIHEFKSLSGDATLEGYIRRSSLYTALLMLAKQIRPGQPPSRTLAAINVTEDHVRGPSGPALERLKRHMQEVDP